MIIKINLKDNREVLYKNKIIGKTFENEATILHFELDEEMVDKDFYIDFEKIDGTKISTPRLEIENNFVKYAIPNSLLDLKGELNAEVVLRKDGVVFKTYTMNFTILDSINATNKIPSQYPDFVSEAQKILDIIETNGKGNMYLSDDGTYKKVSGSGSGTSDYNELENKPQINNVELSNNKTLEELGIQPKGDYANNSDIPTKVSDLTNDIGYLIEIPSEYITETELNNKGYLTEHQDISHLATKGEIPIVPTNISTFNNDIGYLTSYTENDPTVPNHVKSITEAEISKWNSMRNIYTSTSSPTNSDGANGDIWIIYEE